MENVELKAKADEICKMTNELLEYVNKNVTNVADDAFMVFMHSAITVMHQAYSGKGANTPLELANIESMAVNGVADAIILSTLESEEDQQAFIEQRSDDEEEDDAEA